MIELIDTSPDVDVQPAEFLRLLGYPRDRKLKGRSRELAEKSREWYREYGKPWVYARQAQSLEITNGSICIDGMSFVSKRLQGMLRQAEADSVILVAVSAGAELEHEAAKMWQDEKPDEYFFLEVYGSAVVEHLVTISGARLCAWADERDRAILPHYCPGYTDWDISQQPRLLKLIRQTQRHKLPADLDALDSGMLRPKKSLLAVFGVTPRPDRVRRLAELNPCENCSFQSCQYRRAPYLGSRLYPSNDVIAQTKQLISSLLATGNELDRNAQYTVNIKALSRWAGERLTLTQNPNGTTDALFLYEGKTCSNLGRPLLFHYNVTLGSASDGYPIQDESCRPAAGDVGHQSMCAFMENADHLMSAVQAEKPLLGQPLNSVLSWTGESGAAGCYCHAGDRMHKWRLVLETIHFALAQQQARQAEVNEPVAAL